MPAGDLSLAEAAEELGLHYMTLYRYVRTGRVPATRQGREWRVLRRDVAALHGRAGRDLRATEPGGARTSARRRLTARLLAGDEPGAWRIVEDALVSGREPTDVHLDLLVPAMASIGRRWASGRVTVADEHRASAVVTRVVARLGPLFRPRGRRRGTVLVGAVTGDRHAIPTAIATDLLRAAGFEVVDLGADVPVESFAQTAAASDGLVAVVVSVATLVDDALLAQVVDAVRVSEHLVVLAGGPACNRALAAAAGADAHVDLRHLVERLERSLAQQRAG
jgi:excisionase family DNA binding protein